MTVLCGTDLSEGSRLALRAAIALARREGSGVELVHVLDLRGAQALVPPDEGSAILSLRNDLAVWKTRATEMLAVEAGRESGGKVGISPRLIEGAPDVALVQHAQSIQASAIVVSALGLRSGMPFTLGSTADRVAQTARCAVLVVRDPEPFEAWADQRASLRLLIGIDEGPTAKAALAWSARFARLGDVHAIAAHVYWPPEQHEKHPEDPALPLGSGHRSIERELKRKLLESVVHAFGDDRVRLRVVGGLGRLGDHLSSLASEEQAGVLVVGSHQRGGLARFWHGSVSHGAIDRARTNVFVIPETSLQHSGSSPRPA
jgi:nucleotide-binding universal stress UspA family protein